MNKKIQYSLEKDSGDVLKYFKTFENVILSNSGDRDCKVLTIDCQQVAAPFNAGSETKLPLTNPNVHIINIDKSFITCRFEITVKGDVLEMPPNTVLNPVGNKLYTHIFVGLKSAAESIETYRVFYNGNVTECYNGTAIYESFVTRAVKPKSEQSSRISMYSTYENASKMKNSVCGVYIPVWKVFDPASVEPVTFEAVIQIDDLLPFSGMSLFPNCILGDLELQIKHTFQKNLVYCAVDVKDSKLFYESMSDSEISDLVLAKNDMYKKATQAFTQIGDSCNIYVVTHPASGAGPITWKIRTLPVRVSLVGSGRILSCSSTICGYKIKDSEVKNLRNYLTQTPLIIPAQFIEQKIFGQIPSPQGIDCNTSFPMNSCTNVIFMFPRTMNQLTVSLNPYQTNLQCTISNKTYPYVAVDTLSARHAEMMLENAWLDALFGASDAFINSLSNNEVVKEGTTEVKRYLDCDATDYMFNCSVERFGGGVFLDGLDSRGGNEPVVLRSTNIFNGTINPYLNPLNEPKNIYPPVVLLQEDCFWYCTIEDGKPRVEFIRGFRSQELLKRLGYSV
jgi:hypothetical protein